MNFLKFFLFTSIVYFDIIKYYYLIILYIVIKHVNRYYIDKKLSDYKNINLICNYITNNKMYFLLNKYFNIFINEVCIILYDLVNDCFNLILFEKLNNKINISTFSNFLNQDNIQKLEYESNELSKLKINNNLNNDSHKKLDDKANLLSKLKINNNLDNSINKSNNYFEFDSDKFNKLSLVELKELNNQLNLIKDNLKKII